MPYTGRWCAGIAAALALGLAILLLVGESMAPGGQAIAQEKKRNGFNIFRPFFKKKNASRRRNDVRIRRVDPKAGKSRRKTKRAGRRRTTRIVGGRQSRSANRQTARRAITATPKNPDARVVLVIGDFLAAGLARGLGDAYAKNPLVIVADRSMPSSGLVRDDHYDWQENAKTFLENEERIDLVTVLVGANDSQPIRARGKPVLAPRSDGWIAAYRERSAGLMKLFNDAGVPVVWLSAPPMKRSALSTDIAFFNDLQKQSADAAAAVSYVDIWDAFSDENGGYVSTGPDEKGQVRRLRTDDGINLASAGRSKLAFFAKQEIDKFLGGGSRAVAALSPGSAIASVPGVEDGPVRPDVWEMVLTGDNEPKGRLTLAGAESKPARLQPKKGDVAGEIARKRLRDGIPPEVREGRIDELTVGTAADVPRI